MTSKQVAEIVSSAKRQMSDSPRRHKRRIAGGQTFELWPKGHPIAYQFRQNVSVNMRNLVLQAMQLWEGNTCVRFEMNELKENNQETNRLAFQNGPQCASYVGMSGGAQFFHEHTRPNRDTYIRLNFTNIGFYAVDQFAILMPEYLHKLAETSSYEYGSVMHYSAFAFADNGAVPTIIPQSGQEGYQGTMGQRQGPSFLDYFQINQIYCDNSCAGYSTSCRNGGYPNPNACWKCLCPSGFAGSACENVETSRNCPGAGVIRVTETKQSIFTPNYLQGLVEDRECIWLLKADANSVIRYEMIDFDLPCDRVCEKSFVEIKVVMMRNNEKHTKAFRMNFWSVPVGRQLPTTTSKPSNGSFCDFLKSVNLYPCKNGGECKPTIGNAIECICPFGYSGTLCEKDIDECESSPCQNGGTCLDNVGAYECNCPPSFTGTQCETEIDFCSSGPCQNGGACKNGSSSYQCVCLQNYVGSNCETEDRCLWLKEVAGMTPCNNGGVCVSNDKGHQCDCVRGFSGVACETAPVLPLTECQTKLDSANAELSDCKKDFLTNQKKLEKYQKKTESECRDRTKKVHKPPIKLAKCDHPPAICALMRRNYKFAIIGGEDHGQEITFWNASFGTSYLIRNESWKFEYHSAAVLPDGTVLVTGGYPATGEFHLFNMSPGVNVLMSGDMPGPPRRLHGSAALSDGRVFVCGGHTKNDTTSLCSQFKNGRWNEVPSMVSKKRLFGMTSDGRYPYVMGGFDSDDFSSVEYYDTDTNYWTSIQPLPKGPRNAFPIVHVNGKVYAIGGWNGSALNRVEILDTASKQWTDGPSLNTARGHHSAVATPDGSIWVFGGYGSAVDKSVEVLPAGGDRWIPWPHELPREFGWGQVVLV